MVHTQKMQNLDLPPHKTEKTYGDGKTEVDIFRIVNAKFCIGIYNIQFVR